MTIIDRPNLAPKKRRRRKLTGLRHLLAATSYSIGGARRLFGEAAFRHELIGFCVAMVGFVISGATLFQYVAMGILFLMMIAFEALNTAIEEIVDRVSPEISDMGRNAKDLGSLACLCLVLANSGYAFYVIFISHFLPH
ncbi:diacylglycerol kinase [Rhizobium rhizosphaerae]|uniref:Diacylglycerol kinase n=1 Tax=Xaviernesmea rhizosphaerae TaxID=1672749 RepID=A0A1Q9AMW7_9HYPH|nr:diacylglycerol kinase [Xaviernesmea rhizosphaerae]OLP56703.1 diacylglycerol kinase [Xaviernesmea rhizosphaerae]OQP88347.1 diacylglycerol kinase [Xaviernesmea rhizosphaerae]